MDCFEADYDQGVRPSHRQLKQGSGGVVEVEP